MIVSPRWGWALVASLVVLGCSSAFEDDGQNPSAHETVGHRAQALGTPNVTTYHNDISRTGAYQAETQLTRANVNSSTFGKLYERTVQGDINAQPLYMRGISTGAGVKNLAIVATSTNDIYAFDADNTSTDPNAARIWHRNLNPWRPLVIANEICTETVGSVGVSGTPVIDPATNTMYVVTRRSGGRVVAAGGALYQFHNTGLIWRYTGTPCSGASCPGWQLLDNNPAAIQIVANSPDLYQLHRSGAIFRHTGVACTGNSCPGWSLIDNFPGSVRLEAAGSSGSAKLMQLHEDGAIYTSTGGSGWQLNDTNPDTVQIAIGSAAGATRTFQLHRTGKIFLQTGTGIPNWQMLDNNSATVMIAAAGQDLYQLHNNGRIWKYTGVPCSGNSCPGWTMLDNNPATTRIVAAPTATGSNSSVLYQLHTTGAIFQHTGVACTGNSCPSWQMLDNNGGTGEIVADKTLNALYQTHIDGSIWRYLGSPCSGSSCPSWQLLDNNPALNDGGNYLHAVNLTDGSERQAPVRIAATDPQNSSINFDGRCQRNRAALLLLNSVVYVAYGVFNCDQFALDGTPYHGWVFGYRASDLAQVAAFNTSPDGPATGIWQTGGGLVGSTVGSGSVYFETGNDFDSDPARLGDSFVKLNVTSSWPGLTEAAHYTPTNAAQMRHTDTDLGSAGPMLLPGSRLVGGGKQGRYYVMNSSTLALTQQAGIQSDGFEGFQAFRNTYHPEITVAQYDDSELNGPNLHGGPIYYPATSFVYHMPEKDFLKGFSYNTSTGVLSTTPSATASGSWAKPPDGMPGGFSSISSNDNSNGIVWVSLPQADGQWQKVPGVLAAFNAVTLAQLWSDSSQEMFAKAAPPTIADGRVYRATFASDVHHGMPGKLIVYGLFASLTTGLTTAGTAVTAQNQSLQPLASTLSTSDPGAVPTVVGSHTESDPVAVAYWRLGGPQGYLGLPTTQEQGTSDGRGRFRQYQSAPRKTPIVNRALHGAPVKGPRVTLDSAIYWTATTGAHAISGGILSLWRDAGAEVSPLGYPIADETNTDDADGRVQHFEHGDIVWYAGTGASMQLRAP